MCSATVEIKHIRGLVKPECYKRDSGEFYAGSSTSLQQNRRKPLQFFIARIELETSRFQGRHAE